MYCENCGAKIPEGSKFCENCGYKQNYKNEDFKISDTVDRTETVRLDTGDQYNQGRSGYTEELEEVLMTKDYLVMYLLMMVPILNLVLLFIWGFGQGVNRNKRNLARVLLIFMAVSLIPTIISLMFIIPMMTMPYSY